MGVSGGSGDRRKPIARPLERLGRSAPRDDRLRAVAELRARPSDDVLRALEDVAVTAGEDPIVRAAALAALGSNGRTVALEDDPPPAVSSAARRAEAMVRRRTLVEEIERGVGEIQLPRAAALPVSAVATVIEKEALPPEERARVVEASSLPHPGSSDIQAFRCEGNEFALVTRLDLLDPARLSNAPARPAQIAVHHTLEENVWTVPFEVLTAPRRDGSVEVVVVDPTGEARFVGSAEATARGDLLFEVHAAKRPGAAAVTVKGVIRSGRVEIEDARSEVRSVAPRRPAGRAGMG